jgi:hypothetical protein
MTVTDAEGRRHNVDVQAGSTGCRASEADAGDGVRGLTGGKVYRVTGAALQRWIVEKRSSWNGPKGMPFRQRPALD